MRAASSISVSGNQGSCAAVFSCAYAIVSSKNRCEFDEKTSGPATKLKLKGTCALPLDKCHGTLTMMMFNRKPSRPRTALANVARLLGNGRLRALGVAQHYALNMGCYGRTWKA